MKDFLQQNASALFGILGALGAVVLTFVTQWLLRKRDYDLRLWDKLLERRIAAHEALINIAIEMRVMVGLGGVDAEGEVARTPRVLLDRAVFHDFFARATGAGVVATTWLSIEARREFNFLQDYLGTLDMHTAEFPSERLREVGTIIRQDFIDISSSLERVAFAFLQRDVRRLSLGTLDEWHKFPREVTEKRLRETVLLQRYEDLAAMRQPPAPTGGA